MRMYPIIQRATTSLGCAKQTGNISTPWCHQANGAFYDVRRISTGSSVRNGMGTESFYLVYYHLKITIWFWHLGMSLLYPQRENVLFPQRPPYFTIVVFYSSP